MYRLPYYIRTGLVWLLRQERWWGVIRLPLGMVIIYQFARLNSALWAEPGSAPPSLFGFGGLRYWVIPTAVVLGVMLISANYLQQLYRLPYLRWGLRRIMALVFSLAYPVMEVRDGAGVFPPGENNLVNLAGGPGYLRIRPGSGVLLENMTQPTRVLGTGFHYLNRQESVRECFNLADQQGSVDEALVTTKDGIEVAVQNIQFRYRLRTGRLPRGYRNRNPDDPYPFSLQAAQRFAYQRTIQQYENRVRLTPWEAAVQIGVKGAITDYLASHRFDDVTTPNLFPLRPRQEIAAKMQDQVYKNLRKIGTELLWFDIGVFIPVNRDVAGQRVDTWGAKWTGVAGLHQALGEATRLKLQGQGRAEAQANLLGRIIYAINQNRQGESSAYNLRNLIIIQTAQILETMVEAGYVPASREPLPQPDSVTLERELNSGR